MYETIEVVSVPVGEEAGPVEIENSLKSLQSYVNARMTLTTFRIMTISISELRRAIAIC